MMASYFYLAPSAMSQFEAKQWVRLRRDHLQTYAPATARLLDGRKGKVLDVFIPLGKKEALVKVYWTPRRPGEKELVLEHPEAELERIVG